MRLLLLLSIVAYYATSINAVIADSDFRSKFFKTVAEDVSGNMVCSPIGVNVFLSVMASGAQEYTSWQLLRLFDSADEREGLLVQDFLSKLDSSKEDVLHMANNIFLHNKFTLNSNFKESMRLNYVTLTITNFGNSLATKKTINDWCAGHTNNRIKYLVSAGSLGPSTSIVLVSAMYFSGSWLYPFDVNNTTSRPFTVNDTSKDVPTMHIIKPLRYGKLPEIHASYVEVSYASEDKSHEISMYVILPDEVNGFEQLKENLDKVTVKRLLQNATNHMVDLYLPKFKIESSMHLNGPLRKMGLAHIFDNNADLGAMVEESSPNRVQFIQTSFIEVNETGTEAAVATGASSYIGSDAHEASVDLITFDVNRPFVSIVAMKNEAAVLSAIIVDPQTQ